MSQDKLIISYSPHEKSHFTVNRLMWGVVLALLPTTVMGVYYFGVSALKVTLTSVIACVLTEWVVQKWVLRQKTTVSDGSAAITGLLLAFNVPSNLPLWIMVIGAIVAIGVAKLPFGGLGKNPFNPALVGRAFLLASFPVQMTTWPIPGKNLFAWAFPVVKEGVDATTAATALGFIKEGVKQGQTVQQLMAADPHQYLNYWNLFIGNVGGCIGEVSAAAILLGGIYMLWKKIITWQIPIFYLGSLFIFTGIFWLVNPAVYADPLFQILSGGVMLGAFFMATDYVTSPMSVKGQIIFAIGGGILCGAIRLWGGYPEGCSYSILIMNALVPLIDKYVKPGRFGVVKEVSNV